MPQDLIPGWIPHEGQRAFLEAEARYRVLACGRRWGKTDACAAAIIQEILKSGASRQLILAPTLVQAQSLLDRVVEFAETLFPLDCKLKRTPYPNLRVGDHKVWARSGHVGRALRGQGATHVIVDEAAFVPEELITEIALPMLATTHGRLTLLSTPFGKNHFWRLFRRGIEGEEHFWSRQSSSSESPYVSDEFLAIQRELISERAYAVEYEAEFQDSSAQVFRTEAVECATVATLPEPRGPVRIGVDWARYTDYTAVAVLQGDRDQCQLIELHKFNNLNWKEQVARVSEIVRHFPAAMVQGDSTSLGGDMITEQLQDALPGHSVMGYNFTAPSKRALIDSLVMLFDREAIKFLPHLDLLRELQHFEAVAQPSGSIRQAAAHGYHDDLVIALALAAHLLHVPYQARVVPSGTRNFHETQPIQSQTETHSAPRPQPDPI